VSSTVTAPYAFLGEGGDYKIEVNFAVRVYDNKGEKIPNIGEVGYTLKGGLRTNRVGIVPLLDGNKDEVGKAEVLKIVAAKPQNMDMELIKSCGFETIEDAVDYVQTEHGEEFARDGVMTIFVYKVTELKAKPI
jgi:hypothetical protein